MKHRQTHPTPVEGCFGCKALAINIAPSAMPTRNPRTVAVTAKENSWDRDMAAYKRLRDDGLQPASIDGSAVLEGRAETQTEIEMGRLFPGKDAQAKVREGLELAEAVRLEHPDAQREGFQGR